MYLSTLKAIIIIIVVLAVRHSYESTHEEYNARKRCLVSDLKSSVIKSCKSDDMHRNSTYLSSGTRCDIACHKTNITIPVRCLDGTWINLFKDCETFPIEKSVRKKRFIELIIGLVQTVISGLICLFGGCVERDNTKPHFSYCPENQDVVADKLQVYAKVTWMEPYAYDDTDGKVRVIQEKGKRPGRNFPEGFSTVGYYARDQSGNMATCTFHINVKIVKCPWPKKVHNGYYICHPSDDSIFGAKCRFGCYRGYKLHGDNSLECKETGNWSKAFPYCKEKSCKPLPPTSEPLKYECSDESNSKSICTYSCCPGYDITVGMSRVRVCKDDGLWSGRIPTCTDVEPPKFQNCKRNVYVFADRGSTSGQAIWKEPTITDNSGDNIEIHKSKRIVPTQRLTAGNYRVTYTAKDAEGNKAVPCVTNIIVKVLTCSKIYPTPFLKVTCPQGTIYGSKCDFECGMGSLLNGSQFVTCEAKSNPALGIGFGYWKWAGYQPFCDVVQKCAEMPNVPKNGALACDIWFGGKFCQMLCKRGYDVKPGFESYEMLVCSNSGKWIPATALPLPDCARTFPGLGATLHMLMKYHFNGECTDPVIVSEIKKKFIELLNSSSARLACISTEKCKMENVEVLCGPRGRKRSSASSELNIEFDLIVLFETSNFSSTFNTFRQNRRNVIDKFEEAVEEGIFNISLSNGDVIEVTNFDSTGVKLMCPERTIPSYRTSACVECAEGTYHDDESKSCVQCKRGEYQPNSGMLNCLKCPKTKTTKTIGSKTSEQCTDGCEPGSWSEDGTPQCTLCQVGKYSDQYGSIQCNSCPGSRTTIVEGANSIKTCKDFDLKFPHIDSNTSIQTNFSTNSNSFMISGWIQKENLSNDLSISFQNSKNNNIFSLRVGKVMTLSTDRSRNSTPPILTDHRWHSILVYYNNNVATLFMDNFKQSESSIRVDVSNATSLYIQGEGTVSQLNMWSIKNFGLIDVRETTKTCFNNKSGDLVKWKDFEDTDLTNAFKQIPSDCDDFNNCSPNPCLNGNCTDKLGGYECSCEYGFYGNDCEINFDDCVDNVCQNNSTCIDGPANYTCECQYGYKGDLCEIVVVDGSWGEWGNWSSCSLTCGNGTQSRLRRCNNPSPDNGGLDCPDNDTSYQECFEMPCPVCSSLDQLDHVMLSCSNISESINCTMECEEGYDFDHEIKPYYFCGKETFHLWDFQTDDNPSGKTPACSEIQDSAELKITYEATYTDLFCDSSQMVIEIKENIKNTVQSEIVKVNCLSSGVCILKDIKVTKCNMRERRSTDIMTAGLQVEIACDAKKYGSDFCHETLYKSIYDLHMMASNDTFDTVVEGTKYKINISDTSVQSNVLCPEGQVQRKYYCVKCSPGRYYRNGECVRCGFGTFQDQYGQKFCKDCPDETTTPGRESISRDECSVQILKMENTDQLIVWYILGTAAFSAVIISMLVPGVLIWRRNLVRHHKETERKISNKI